MSVADPADIDEFALRRAISDALELDPRQPVGVKFRPIVADIAANEVIRGTAEWLTQNDDDVHDECVKLEDFNRTAELVHDLISWINDHVTMEQWAITGDRDDGNSDLLAMINQLQTYVSGIADEPWILPSSLPNQDEIDVAESKRKAALDDLANVTADPVEQAVTDGVPLNEAEAMADVDEEAGVEADPPSLPKESPQETEDDEDEVLDLAISF